MSGVPRPRSSPGTPAQRRPAYGCKHTPLRFGRDPSCDVVIAEPTVSRRHAQASWDGHELVIEDLGSSGGTFVNDVKVQRAVLHPGDVVRLGPRTEYLAQTEESSSALEIAAEQSGSDEGGVRHLQTLLEVARALNAATVLEEVVHVVLQAAVRLLRADRGCVILIENGVRRTVACHPRDLPETTWAARSSLFDRALAERRVVHAGVELSPSTFHGRPRGGPRGRSAARGRPPPDRTGEGRVVRGHRRGHRRHHGRAGEGRPPVRAGGTRDPGVARGRRGGRGRQRPSVPGDPREGQDRPRDGARPHDPGGTAAAAAAGPVRRRVRLLPVGPHRRRRPLPRRGARGRRPGGGSRATCRGKEWRRR